MEDEYCKYSIRVKEGLTEYLMCSKSSDYCRHQRYCTTKKTVVHTDDVKNCSILKAEEESKMANKKQNNRIRENKDSASKIEVEETADSIINEEKAIKTGVVIVATPNYYIVSVDGSNVKCIEKNNYKEGDIVEI